jgi:hypothetical protein
MSYKNRHNHSGRYRRNQRTHELIDMILFYLNFFEKVDIIRMMR